MTQIYKTIVTELGESVTEFYSEKMIVLFKGGAPAELAEFCVIHEENKLYENIQPGDVFKIDDSEFRITAVGSSVNENLQNLGHITLKFDGAQEAELPGTLYLENSEVPEIQLGQTLEVVRT